MERFNRPAEGRVEESSTENLSVQVEANLESNDSLLLFERLSNPNIQEQIFNVWMAGYRARAESGEPVTRVRYDEDGKMELYEEPFVVPTEDKVRADINSQIEFAKTSTQITFDSAQPHAHSVGIFWKMPDGTDPTTKQKSIMLAHEKGHLVRQFPEDQEGGYYRKVFAKAFDVTQANYTDEDIETEIALLRQAQETEIEETEEDRYLYDNVLQNMQEYLERPEELVERMGQLKNYFGFTGDEEFTQEHLDYARKNYIKDTGMDNRMRHFFESIIDDGEFLRLINSVGA